MEILEIPCQQLDVCVEMCDICCGFSTSVKDCYDRGALTKNETWLDEIMAV